MGRPRSEVPTRLEQLKARFESWRRLRRRGDRIPQRLWDAAVEQAQEVGVNRTAKALKLDYYGLKRRLTGRDHGEHAPTFVELPSMTLCEKSQCTLELEDDRGRRLKLQLQEVDPQALATISQGLWMAK